MGLVDVQLEQSAFDQPTDPVSSQGMRRFGVDVETAINAMLNGLSRGRFSRQLFQTSTELTISGGSITPTLTLHSVKAQTGSADELDTIAALQNSFIVLRAKTGHVISLRHAVNNISIPGGANFQLAGNRAALLYCQGSQYSLIGTTRPLYNVSATADPGSTDDAASGYSVDAIWVNTTLDRAWVCIDATTGAAIWKLITPWKNWFALRASSTNVGVGIGTTPNLSSGNGNDTDANDTFVVLNTGTSIGDTNYFRNDSFVDVLPAYSPIMEAHIKSAGDISSQRIWIGLTSATPNNANALTAGIKYIGFRYAQGTDTGWTPIVSDGAAQTTGTTIGTVAINTVYKLRIRIDAANSRAYFSVNDGAEQVVSTTFPALTTGMSLFQQIYTLTTAARSLRVSYAEVGW